MAFSPTTIATQTTSARDPRELYEIKQKAVKYYSENGVPNKMEDVLNVMFYENPPDAFGYLVGHAANQQHKIGFIMTCKNRSGSGNPTSM